MKVNLCSLPVDPSKKIGDKFLSDSFVSYIEKWLLESICNDIIVKIYKDIKPRRIQM